MKDIVSGSRAELKFGATRDLAWNVRDLAWNVWGAVLIGLVLSAMVAYAETRTVDGAQSPAVNAAQGRPDFTGTWLVETIELPERPEGGAGSAPGGMGGRGGRMGGGRRGSGGGMSGGRREGAEDGGPGGGLFRPQAIQKGDQIRVKQTADRLIVTEKADGGERMSIYALDGSETTNFAGRGSVKSKTKWEGVALVVDSTQKIETPMGDMTVKMRDVRSAGEDGKTMTVRSTVDTPRGKLTTTVTYVKRAESETDRRENQSRSSFESPIEITGRSGRSGKN